jgi:putative chitinase
LCIEQSVGRNGVNQRRDVKTIQLALNMNLGRLVPLAPLAVDGGIGGATITAIEEFQRRVMSQTTPDGRVDPNGRTLKELAAGMPPEFNAEKLSGIMIDASQARINLFFVALDWKMTESGIDTPLRMAHFLAQLAHESAQLVYTEEVASGEAYEGRADLGNTQPGDGKRFKGRGLIQLTGRKNYTDYGKERNKDYTTDTNAKTIATDPWLAVDASCWFWVDRGLNEIADRDDVLAVTRVINGGYNGLADRKDKLARAKFFLGCR